MSFGNKKKNPENGTVNVDLYRSDYQIYSLEAMQQIPFESVPKDQNGVPFGIISRTKIQFNGDNYSVDVYNDTENNEGVCVLPDGSKGKINDEVYRRHLAAFDEELAAKKREEIEDGISSRGHGTKKSPPLEKKPKMSKAEKAEAKRQEKIQAESESITGYKSEKNKKTLALILYIAAVAVILLLARGIVRAQQDTVEVIRLKNDMLSGDVLSEEDIEPYSMLESVYESLGKSTYVSDGSSVTSQTMLTWDQKDEVVNKYMTCYTQAGQILTSRQITDETTTRNPWLALAEAGQEVYTMPFSASDVNSSLLYPGCHMRVRLIVKMQYDEYQQYLNDQNNTSSYTPSLSPVTTIEPTDSETSSTGADLTSLLEMAQSIEGVNVINEASVVEHADEVPVVEIVFDDLQAIDMLNGSNQSIYELYMALLKLPLDERVEYLNTKLTDNDTANTFRSTVLPTRLVFLLSKDQADMLARFENMENSTFKFTILLTEDEDDNIVSSFIDISSQIHNAISDEQ